MIFPAVPVAYTANRLQADTVTARIAVIGVSRIGSTADPVILPHGLVFIDLGLRQWNEPKAMFQRLGMVPEPG